MNVVVVGAGMSGLVAANEFVANGHEVTVLDKGRAVGGRMASKRFEGARFDHGAQHFSVRSRPFAELVQELSFAGVVGVWYEGKSLTTDRGVEPRHRGVPAMRSICEHLADGLDVRTGARVDRVEAGLVLLEADERVEADAIIVTAPVPQTLDLVDPELLPADQRQVLESIGYEPCIAVMAVLGDASGLTDGHLAPSGGPIAWIADNHHKGVSEIPAVTIHSTPRYARANLEADRAVWLGDLVAEFERITGVPVVTATAHRWRFSRPTNPLETGFLELGSGVWLAGEAFSGARIEGAFTSGRLVAERVGGQDG